MIWPRVGHIHRTISVPASTSSLLVSLPFTAGPIYLVLLAVCFATALGSSILDPKGRTLGQFYEHPDKISAYHFKTNCQQFTFISRGINVVLFYQITFLQFIIRQLFFLFGYFLNILLPSFFKHEFQLSIFKSIQSHPEI